MKRSRENRSAFRRMAAPSNRSARARASPSANGSTPGSRTSTPVSPASTVSQAPPRPYATTGRPQAWASIMTLPKVSVVLGKRKRSALAKAVSRLESSLGVKLFHRTTREVSLTPDGERMFHRCQRVLAEIEDLQADAAGTRAAPSGLLRVDLPIVYGKRVVLPLLAALVQRHPALELIYRFKQKLCYLLLKKHRTRKQCQPLAARFLKAVHQLRQAGLPQLMQLGETLHCWQNEIALMWRFTRNNGITEGFHTKMEVLQRQAYGFRNFNNYRLRVKIMCASKGRGRWVPPLTA